MNKRTRLIFSLPKNVKYFKVVFPTRIFSKMVDIHRLKSESDKLWRLVKELEDLDVRRAG